MFPFETGMYIPIPRISNIYQDRNSKKLKCDEHGDTQAIIYNMSTLVSNCKRYMTKNGHSLDL